MCTKFYADIMNLSKAMEGGPSAPPPPPVPGISTQKKPAKVLLVNMFFILLHNVKAN